MTTRSMTLRTASVISSRKHSRNQQQEQQPPTKRIKHTHPTLSTSVSTQSQSQSPSPSKAQSQSTQRSISSYLTINPSQPKPTPTPHIKRITLPEGDSWMDVWNTLPPEIMIDSTTFQSLIDMKPSEHGKIKVYGKVWDVPRWQQSFGRDYYFSGLNHTSQPITHPYLILLLDWVQNHSKLPYTQILINWYMSGHEYISPHGDDESQLIPNSSIYSFTFGVTRDFIIKSKKKTYKLVLPLPNNTLVIMGGEMQKYFTHQVPKRLTIKEPRINITCRLYKKDIADANSHVH